MKRHKLLAVVGLALTVVVGAGTLEAQHDPGPRGGAAGAGGFFSGLSPDEQSFFKEAIGDFMEVDSVSGSVSGESGSGLGPTFNGNSCAQCHAQPAVGGSSPGLTSKQNAIPNPQVALANLDGATNTVPSFVTANGPVREARFIKNPDGSLDVYIQNVSPGKEKESNWLPAPKDNFNLIMRIYWPKQEVLERRWTPPGIQRIS